MSDTTTTPENDSQDVQPDTNEQPKPEEAKTPEVDPQIEEMQKEIAEKDEQIANLAKAKRQAKKDAKKADAPKAEEKQKSDGLDYGEKAYLNTKEIAESEHGFIEDQLADSGLELNELLENGYFKAQLQEFRDKAAVADATPQGTRGAKESAKSKADYWVDRGEMPENTPANFKLRQEIVNTRIAQEKGEHSQFTSTPVIESGLA